MNEKVFTTAHASLHGALAGMLSSAWRRSAEQALLDAGATAGRPLQGRPRAARPRPAIWALALGWPLVVAGAAVAVGPPESREAGAAQAPKHAAMHAFLAQRYATAYGRFAQLADDGDASAAQMALAMVCQGPSLFGSEWSATPGQLRRWAAMAAREAAARGPWVAEHDRGE